MNIALLGYGKMGKTIEIIAKQRGHQVVLIVDKDDSSYSFDDVDVAIDFSLPTAAVENISNCINHQIPVVSGTTGWLDRYAEMVSLCEEKNGTFLYASNFSLGVNIFFEINRQLAKLITGLPEYSVRIEEIHHTQKLDAPSGTAISLAEGIIEHSSYSNWTMDADNTEDIHISSKRIDDVPGTHTISYESEVDTIDIKHTAHSRKGFALGAVIAAEYIVDKKGVFDMKDVLNIG